MTRKDFELFAGIIRMIDNRTKRIMAAGKAMKRFQEVNALFDKDKFLEACDL